MKPTDCTDCKRGGTFVKNRIMISALCICILLAASGCGVGAGSDVPSDDNREEVEGQDGFELQEDVVTKVHPAWVTVVRGCGQACFSSCPAPAWLA